MAAFHTKQEDQRQSMLNAPVYKIIPVIAAPMVLSMMIDSIYNMTDAYFVSSLGSAAVAAVGINDSLLGYMRSIAMLFATGASSVISRLLGARKDKEANAFAVTTFFSSLVLLSLFAAIVYAAIGPAMELLGATGTVKPYSVEYARYILLAAPFFSCEVLASFLLRAEGSTARSMWGTCTGCVVNLILDPILILPWGLNMGVAGAAIATGIGKVVSCVILLLPFLRKKTMLELRLRNFTLRWSLYRETFNMGSTSLVRDVLMTSSWVLMNNVAGGFGDAALAAVTIAKKVINLVSTSLSGIGQGYQPLAGFCWGARKFARVRETFSACTKLGCGTALFLGILLSIFARPLAGLFAQSGETEVTRLAAIIIASQALTLIPHVWGVIINGLCLAGRHPVFSILVGLSRNFICLIPVLLVLPRLFGVEGVALAGATANVLSMAIILPITFRLLRECRALESAEPADPTTPL